CGVTRTIAQREPSTTTSGSYVSNWKTIRATHSIFKRSTAQVISSWSRSNVMFKLRLRTKFLLSLLLVSSSITLGTVWMVGRRVRVELRKEIAESLRNSVVVFRDFQRQREIGLASSAEILASLPNLKALMTTRDAVTIQDASADIWRLTPSDVFVLANPLGEVLAIHTN